MKEEDFEFKTKEILNNTIQIYKCINNEKRNDSNYRGVSFRGTYQILEKAGFADNQDISYLDSTSIVAQKVAANYQFTVSSIFLYYNIKKFDLKPEYIFEAVKNLELDSNRFIIISMGMNLSYYNDILGINGLKKDPISGLFSFNNIIICDFHSYMHDLIRNSIFIIEKSDLPTFIYKEIPQEEKEKYYLKKLENEVPLYAKIVDLKETKELREEIFQKFEIKDLSKSVLVCVDLHAEIRLKYKSKCIQLKEFSQFIDRDNPDNIDDVEYIW